MNDERTYEVCPLSMRRCVMELYDETDCGGRHPVCRFAEADSCTLENVLDSAASLLAQLVDGWQENPIRVKVER